MNEAGPMPCPNCGTRTEANAAACPRCGLPRNNPVFGPDNTYLGTSFAPVRQARPVPPAGPPRGAGHTPATLTQPVPPPPAIGPEQDTRRGGRRTLAIILGAVVVIVLGVAAGLIITNLPSGQDADLAVPASRSAAPTSASPSAGTEPSPTPTAAPSTSEPATPTPTSSPRSAGPVEEPTTRAPSPATVPDPTTQAPPPRRGPADNRPITGTETYVVPGSGASCVGPAGWSTQDYQGGHQWYSGAGEVLCGSINGGTDRVRSMVEDEWARTWEVTFSDGDARQYRASGYTDDGRIFWLGAKNRSGSSETVMTYWIYPRADKGDYDVYIEQAWQQLSPP
ncbi:MAG: hypothetical protein GXX86_10440 [Propionibacterium sp.]|nr:hypothetical protein [Propionibacterium sp.]